MATSYHLTSLKTEGNNLLENKLPLAQISTHFRLWSGIRMGLKLTEVTIRTTYYRFMGKKIPPKIIKS